MLPFMIVCAVCCAALVVSERRGSRAGVWVSKTLAAAAFVATALAGGALATSYGQLVLVALCLCMAGDVLLIPRDREGCFLAGLASFLLGHVMFGVAFWERGVSPSALTLSGLAALVFALLCLRWLTPHLSGVFRVAVPAYVAVIALMMALAGGATAASGDPSLAAGAVIFAASDLTVARDRLIAHDFWNGAVGLPLYFGAQLILASTVAL